MDEVQVRHTLSSASLPSITEFSEPISEADEIESVLHLQRLGDEAFKRRDFHRAVSLFTDALEIDEENAQVLTRRAIANLHLHNYKQSRRDAEILIKFNPHVAKGHQLLGMCYQKLNKPKSAVSSYLRAIQLDEGHADSLMSRLIQATSGLCENRSIEVDTGAPLSCQLMVIGNVLTDAHQPLTGREVFHVLVSLKSLDSDQKLEVLFLLGCSYHNTKEYERASDFLRQCLTLALSSHQTVYIMKCYLQIVKISFSTKDYEMGVVYAQNIIGLCEDGIVDLSSGESSMNMLDIAQQMDEGLVLAYRALGNMDTALHHAKKYIANIEKQDPCLEIITKAHWLLGVLQEANNRLHDALESYQRFLKFSKQKQDRGCMARAYGCLGRIYHRLGNLALARSYYEQQMYVSEQLKYYTMLAPVLKNLAHLHRDVGDGEATLKYLGMYLRVSRKLDEFKTECRAFICYGDFYHERKEYFLARHYYEEAVNLAKREGEKEMEMISSLKLARTLVESAEKSESVAKALPLISAARAFFEGVALARQKEGGMVPDEVEGCIQECFTLQQVALYSLKLPMQALDVSEANRRRKLHSSLNESCLCHPAPDQICSKMNFSTKKGMDALRRHVTAISHPVLYLSAAQSGIFGWLLTSGPSDIHHRFTKVTDVCHIGLIQSNLSKLGHSKTAEYDIECRQLPLDDSEKLQGIRSSKDQERGFTHEAETIFTSSDSEGNDDTIKDSVVDDDLGPLRILWSLLLEPFIAVLQNCTILTVIVDELLLQVPFDCLFSSDELPPVEQLRVNLVPSLHFLFRHTTGSSWEGNPPEENQKDDPRSSGTSPVYLDQLLRVTVRPVDQPHQPIRNSYEEPPDMAATHPNPSFIAFNATSHNLFTEERGVLKEVESRTLASSNAKGSTLITEGWNNGEVPSSREGAIQVYKPSQSTADILVMGNPKLPPELQWHDKVWRPAADMIAAQSEVHQISSQLNATPCTGSAMTKDEVLQKLPTAMIIHIATYGSWTDGVFVCSPNPITSNEVEGALPMDQYLITHYDIHRLKVTAGLVVLNLGYGRHRRDLSMKLPVAFLEAGVKSVLLPQWAVCNAAQAIFWSQFYKSFHTGIHVTEALKKAKSCVRSDPRFSHPRHWAGYCLLGDDPMIDLSKMKSAALDNRLNQLEDEVLRSFPKDVLNLTQPRDTDHSTEALITKLSHCLSELLLQHQGNRDVIPAVVQLMEGYCSLSRSAGEGAPQLPLLHPSIASSPAAINLLSLVGFHFQPSGVDPDGPPVTIYPQWDPDQLKDPTLQALHGIAVICDSPECSVALSKVIQQVPPLLSSLLDVLAITKHMPEIQMRILDSGVARVWNQKNAKDLVSAVGFDSAGTLLMYKRSLRNQELLSGVLEVLCALTGEKGRAMLHQVDPRFLGTANRRVINRSPSWTPVMLSRLGRSSVLRTPEVPPQPPQQLPSLNPVLVAGSKMTFATSWRSLPEQTREQQEKVKVAKSLEVVHREARGNAKMTNEWHCLSTSLQASQTLTKLGQTDTLPAKVKVHPSGSMSSLRVPLGYKPPLTLAAIEQRRDYAHFILKERQADVERRHKKAVREVFLPYVKMN